MMILYEVFVYSTSTIVLPTLLMILFRRKYPRWWFDFNLELTRFTTRFGAYLGLLVDEYPSTDEAQRVDLELVYPDAEADLNRWLPLVKWLLLLPHYIVLAFLWFALFVVTFIAWFAILNHRRLPARVVRLRRGRQSLDAARAGVRLAADDGPLPALQPGVTGARAWLGHSWARMNATMPSIAAARLSACVRPEALRGLSEWSPSGSHCIWMASEST